MGFHANKQKTHGIPRGFSRVVKTAPQHLGGAATGTAHVSRTGDQLLGGPMVQRVATKIGGMGRLPPQSLT